MRPNKCHVILYKNIILCLIISLAGLISGCKGNSSVDVASVDITTSNTGGRTNETIVLKPVASGVSTISSSDAIIDYSNASEGYIVFTYTGDTSKVKLQLTGSNQITYTYNIIPDNQTVIPLSQGSGDYDISVYENIENDQYALSMTDRISVTITNEFGPFLYPNQYVYFDENFAAVKKAAELAKDATCDLEVVGRVYDFVINNVTYDHEEAKTVASNYLPDVDEVMSTGKGICFDYASLMAAMLRSQGIPTRLEIGYAKDAYHAWISVFTKDLGWIGGVIKFDGTNWTLMDPTLASNSKDIGKIKDFIGDGSSYTVKYMY